MKTLRDRAKSLFKMTSPTALILDELGFYISTCHFLANRGLRIPQDVSLACLLEVPESDWCEPAISQIRRDLSKLSRPVLRWAENVKRGKKDIRQVTVKMEFVPGGTIAPVRKHTIDQACSAV